MINLEDNTPRSELDAIAIIAMSAYIAGMPGKFQAVTVARRSYALARAMMSQRKEPSVVYEEILQEDSVWDLSPELISIDNLHLSRRTSNCLKAEGIGTIKELIAYKKSDIWMLPGFGAKCMRELLEQLSKTQYTLKA